MPPARKAQSRNSSSRMIVLLKVILVSSPNLLKPEKRPGHSVPVQILSEVSTQKPPISVVYNQKKPEGLVFVIAVSVQVSAFESR